MKKKEIKHTSKHFFHTKAILEYYDSDLKLLDREEFDIEREKRFLFHGLELEFYYVSFDERYEIILYEPFKIKQILGKYHYVPFKSGRIISQKSIDSLIFIKINSLPNIEIPNFLAYQLKKYKNRKERLKAWRIIAMKKKSYWNPTNKYFDKEKQIIALDWIESRIRKRNLREFKKDKDIHLKDLFISEELMNKVLNSLVERDYIQYNDFMGRYEWLGKGQDLAALGEILEEKKYLIDGISFTRRHIALTRFFNVTGKKGFGGCTFRSTNISEFPILKKGQFSFIRPVS